MTGVPFGEGPLQEGPLFLSLVGVFCYWTSDTFSEEGLMIEAERRMAEILADMGREVRGLESVLLVDEDGFVLSRWGDLRVDEEFIGGVIAALVGMTRKTADQLALGPREWIGVHGKEKRIFLWEVTPSVTLAAVATPQATTGLLLVVAPKVIQRLKEVV